MRTGPAPIDDFREMRRHLFIREFLFGAAMDGAQNALENEFPQQFGDGWWGWEL